ncbi:hypothetical protein HNP40_000754 [Mycobacteroides chelonae]|nr:hypothetical protein [Mycobacteroides chelonae]
MRHPLDRLHDLKLALIAVSVSFAGFILMVLAKWLNTQPGLSALSWLPWSEIGGTLFTAGILGIGVDYLLRRDDEERAEQRLQRVLTSQAPAMRRAVINGFAFEAEDLAAVATPETLDRIIRNSLALRLGDAEFAAETYDDVRDRAIASTERWHDATIAISLTTASGKNRAENKNNNGNASDCDYIATIRWDYTTVPQHSTRRFAVVSDRAEYRDLMADPDGQSIWFFRPEGHIDAGSPEAFELVQFSVNGEPKPIRRSSRKHGQTYIAAIGEEHLSAGKPMQVSYTYRVLLNRDGHLLHLDMEAATRNITIDLDYSQTDIDYINVLDFFVSSHKTRIQHMPPTVPERSISVAHTGWVSQRSGVAFVWANNNEESATGQAK